MTNLGWAVYVQDIDQPKLVILTNLFLSVCVIIASPNHIHKTFRQLQINLCTNLFRNKNTVKYLGLNINDNLNLTVILIN